MPISLRLNNELEIEINKTAKKLNISKTEIVRRSLKKYFSENISNEENTVYSIYSKIEKNIPGSGHGLLSINHREEVMKKIRKKVSK
ncbi:hypothetical protein HY745_10630 [Candidatus Desantisbacteria bacterium]|nr:hypothetical protein [Candidatus Desantisbacteria bacterium]